MFRRVSALFLIVFVLTGLGLLAGYYYMLRPANGKILPGVSCAGVSLGGLSVEKAGGILEEYIIGIVPGNLVITSGGSQWSIPLAGFDGRFDCREAAQEAFKVGRSGSLAARLSELLGSKARTRDIPLLMKVGDREELLKSLDSINRSIRILPVDARLVSGDGGIERVPSSRGKEMDVAATVEVIERLPAGGKLSVEMVVLNMPPAISDEDLAGLTDIIGECTTSFDPYSEARVDNIRLASRKLDGTLVKPGEVFSFNSAVAPVNRENGYQVAPVLLDGQVGEDFGGGICQVSSTLYGAVLLSGMEIVERHPHVRPVKYTAPGLDATVSSGIKDFRFRNTLDRPVYIISIAGPGGGSVRVSIAGVKKENIVNRVETEEKTISPGIVLKSSRHLKKGQSLVTQEGSSGFEVNVYRVAGPPGKESRELVSTDYYAPVPRVVEVGVTMR